MSNSNHTHYTARQVVERYWDTHFRREWENMATFFTPESHYTDVGLDGDGATGPKDIIARLKLGIDPLEEYWHLPKHVIAEGSMVVTEHVEVWKFGAAHGEDAVSIYHPFTSVMEVDGNHIMRWHDYSHLPNIIDNAPKWWLEHIASGWKS